MWAGYGMEEKGEAGTPSSVERSQRLSSALMAELF